MSTQRHQYHPDRCPNKHAVTMLQDILASGPHFAMDIFGLAASLHSSRGQVLAAAKSLGVERRRSKHVETWSLAPLNGRSDPSD